MCGNSLFICLLCVIYYCNLVFCGTTFLKLSAPTFEEISYMKKYGYLPELPEDVEFTYTALSVAPAVRKMQAFAGLPQTGVLDEETRKLFTKKRCGVKDIFEKSQRRRRYILQQSWGKKTISYRILNGASTLDKDRIEAHMASGLAMWAPHGGLNFTRVESGRADIEVSFASGDHNDGFPFDGPGNVVAHAFAPPHGAMHFDDDETWGENPDEDDEDTTDFFAAAAHEIGHALGLSHSIVKASVMYPYYQVPVKRLHMDDILGMQELYLRDEVLATPEETPVFSPRAPGPSPAAPRLSTSADSEEEPPELCYTNYDTVQVLQGKIFVFEEDWMWVLRDKKLVEEGYPRKIHTVFHGLPESIHLIKTVYERRNGNIVVFHGRSYYEFNSSFRLLKRGSIAEYGIPPYVSELTTVFISNYNNKTYLIEYEQFWRFDETTRVMDPGYPKEMSAWRQLPYPVDAALIWDGDTYFFRGPRFWRFDNTAVRAHPHYPLPAAQVWFPCSGDRDMNRYITNDER